MALSTGNYQRCEWTLPSGDENKLFVCCQIDELLDRKLVKRLLSNWLVIKQEVQTTLEQIIRRGFNK